GFGAGAVDSGLNSYAAENLSAKHMNWLHGSWGIGATLSPLIITFGISTFSSWRYGYGLIGISVLILSLVVLGTLSMWDHKSETANTIDSTQDEKPVVKGIAPFLSIMTYVIYVGIEGGLGLWLSALLIESRGVSIGLAGTMVGIYFGSITVGRFLMGMIANRLGNRQLVNLGILISFVGAVAFCIPSQPVIYGLGILLIGLGFAPIYPTMMHETSNRYGGEQAKKIIGNQVAFSYVSMLIFIPALGFIATHTFLEIIPIITVVAVILLWLVIRKLNQLT
ncbi:MAG: MFS transporter, partial [Turicibacter sp.]